MNILKIEKRADVEEKILNKCLGKILSFACIAGWMLAPARVHPTPNPSPSGEESGSKVKRRRQMNRRDNKAVSAPLPGGGGAGGGVNTGGAVTPPHGRPFVLVPASPGHGYSGLPDIFLLTDWAGRVSHLPGRTPPGGNQSRGRRAPGGGRSGTPSGSTAQRTSSCRRV